MRRDDEALRSRQGDVCTPGHDEVDTAPDIYLQAWVCRDQEFASSRQFDGLFRFLFLDAPEELWRDPTNALAPRLKETRDGLSGVSVAH